MTNSEIHIAFKVIMDKNSASVAYGGCPAFLPEEEDLWLNLGLIEVVFNKFTGTNVKREAFEGSVKRIADLQSLVSTDKALPLIKGDNNYYVLSEFFNDKRMLFVDAEYLFDGKRVPCKWTAHSEISRLKDAYNNKAWIEQPIIIFEDGDALIYVDSTTMMSSSNKAADFTYIKYPSKIDYRLPNEDHDDIPDYIMMEAINRAVTLALENIESQRTQSKLELNNIQE